MQLRRLHQKLERAEVVVTRHLSKLHSGVENALAQSLWQIGRRRDLDELLMAALNAAIALAKVTDRARAVADNLHFDVSRRAYALLNIDRAIAKRRLRFGLAARISLCERV